jgi:AraC family ethanolamine operon transcriptional activator
MEMAIRAAADPCMPERSTLQANQATNRAHAVRIAAVPVPTLAADMHPGRVQSLRFDDMDVMAKSMISGHIDFVPLCLVPFQGQLCQIDLSGFALKRLIHTPLLIHGTVSPDKVALSLLVRPDGCLTLNGEELGASTLAVISGGAAIQAICPVEQDRISLVFRALDFDRLIDSCGAQMVPRGQHQMLHLRQDHASTLARTFAAMTGLGERLPDLFAMPCLRNALTEECLRLLAGAMSCEKNRAARPRQTRDMLRQVRAADEFLHVNITRPVYTEELCTTLQVSPRTLHQSFATVYGMSPCAYLKRRRLALVHRALQSAPRHQVLVKSIVLAHGFWHLGRFAHEYAAMFGEMPSVTLGRGRN